MLKKVPGGGARTGWWKQELSSHAVPMFCAERERNEMGPPIKPKNYVHTYVRDGLLSIYDSNVRAGKRALVAIL